MTTFSGRNDRRLPLSVEETNREREICDVDGHDSRPRSVRVTEGPERLGITREGHREGQT